MHKNLCRCCLCLSRSYPYWNLYLVQVCQRLINCLVIPLHHCLTAFTVGLLNTLFDLCDSLFLGKDTTDREEAGLHNCIDASSHTSVTGYLLCVYHIEAQSLVKKRVLRRPTVNAVR